MSTPDETPTERRPAKWVGSAPINGPWRDPPPVERTLDLPVNERVPAPPPPPAASRRNPPPPPPPPPAPRPWPPVREGWEPPSLRRRRRRKWPWVLLVMLVFCGGCCGLTYRWGKQFYDQYPSAANTAATVTGLAVVDDAAATTSAVAMRKAFDSDQLDESRFTVVYADTANGRARVTVFGTTRFITDPAKALTDGLQKLTPIVELSGVRDVDAGSLGGTVRCGSGRLSGKKVSVCAWADHGSLGGAVFASRGIETSAPLMQRIRASVIRRQSY